MLILILRIKLKKIKHKKKMDKRIKISFMLPTLYAGGAERVVSFISQTIDKNKFNPNLVITNYQKDAKFQVENVAITFLNKKKVRHSIFKLIINIKKNKPQIVFSSLSHLNIVLAFISILFPKTKFIARETFLVSSTKDYEIKKSSKLTYLLRKISYSLIDILVCQSEDMKNDIVSYYSISPKKVKVINNPLTVTKYDAAKYINKNSEKIIKFITIGRLDKIKGHKRILNLLSKIEYDFKYTIIGDGILKKELKDLVLQLSLTDKVDFIDFTSNVYEYLSKNDFFLQGSYIEGFPNTALESCSVGTPVIAFDVPGGTKEIISNGENGYLAKNEQEYFNYLVNINSFERENVKNVVFSKFSKEKILQQYEDLFLNLLS